MNSYQWIPPQKTPTPRAQGTLWKKGQTDCKSQMISEFIDTFIDITLDIGAPRSSLC